MDKFAHIIMSSPRDGTALGVEYVLTLNRHIHLFLYIFMRYIPKEALNLEAILDKNNLV